MSHDTRPIHALSATELAAAIRRGDLTATAVCEHYLARIAALNPTINAYTRVLADEAREAATRADAASARGESLGPLHGVPLAVKDLFAVRGLPTTAGSRLRANDPPAAADATALARLRAAGAVLLGTTNMDEFAAGFTTENGHHGPTRNPADPSRIAGGSSGGSAAAVAAGLAAVALGSDTNGSIRVPASLCGVVGLKPTYGRVSRAGVVPYAWSLDCVGPLARTVEDAALVYDLIAGHDPIDPTCRADSPSAIRGSLAGNLPKLRIGVPRAQIVAAGRPDVVARFDAVVARLAGFAAVRDVRLEWVEYSRPAAGLITAIEGAAYHRRDIQARPFDFDPAIRDRFRASALLPASAYVQAQRVRSLFRSSLAALFSEVDLLVTPTTPWPATPVGETAIEFGGAVVSPRQMLGYATQPFSLGGLPAISVPLPPLDSGLPIGLQIVGPALGEALVCQVGARLVG